MLVARQRNSTINLPVASTSAVPYHAALTAAAVNHTIPPSQPTPTSSHQHDQLDKSGGRPKKYVCPHQDCGKAYTRPVRLEEHLRSHTGERPFKCKTCDSTFLRESHLKAHCRTHLDEDNKSFACQECDKKFWTSQHQRKHIEVVHRGKTYDCVECGASFRKHNLLRTHVAEEHSPPGTNPFRCEHPGCGKSFKQNVHLKSHTKMHDPSRYMCAHPDCLALPLESRQFPNWSALGKHTKTAHPPRCPHPQCNGRTFASSRGLKGHLQLHEEGAEEAVLLGKKRRTAPRKARSNGTRRVTSESEHESAENSDRAIQSDEEEDSEWEERQDDERDERMQADFARGGKKKRRMMARIDTDSPWQCARCPRRFKSSNGLASHNASNHAAQDVASTPKALLSTRQSDADQATVVHHHDSPAHPDAALIDVLTGAGYAPSKQNPGAARKYRCPYPSILEIGFPLPQAEVEGHDEDHESLTHNDGRPCAFWFDRAYDIERHLQSQHNVDVARGDLEQWLAERAA